MLCLFYKGENPSRMGTLLPWNFFITPYQYWIDKLDTTNITVCDTLIAFSDINFNIGHEKVNLLKIEFSVRKWNRRWIQYVSTVLGFITRCDYDVDEFSHVFCNHHVYGKSPSNIAKNQLVKNSSNKIL